MEEYLGKLGGSLWVNRYVEQFTSLITLDLSSYSTCNDDYEQYDEMVLYISTAIRKLTNLRSLKLPSLKTIKGNIFDDSLIKGLINLTDFSLDERESGISRITDYGIQSFTKLTTLHLGLKKGSMITDRSIQYSTNLTDLSLTLEDSSITDISLKGLTNLKTLSICANIYADIDDEKNEITFNALGAFINLTSLSLGGMINITDKTFKNLTNLRNLNLNEEIIISDESMKLLTNLTSLSLLILIYSNKYITNDGISTLINLEILSLRDNKRITDEGVSRLTNLIKLDLSYNSLITVNGLIGLSKLMIIYFNNPFRGDDDRSRYERMKGMVKYLPNRNKNGFICSGKDFSLSSRSSSFWDIDLTKYDYKNKDDSSEEESEEQ
jgi:hypothetical protein